MDGRAHFATNDDFMTRQKPELCLGKESRGSNDIADIGPGFLRLHQQQHFGSKVVRGIENEINKSTSVERYKGNPRAALINACH